MILKKDAGRFAELIRKAGARPALYMVWPSRDRPQDWAGVDTSYTDAAAACRCLLLPAGRAWHFFEKGDSPLFGDDGFHPTPTGSDLGGDRDRGGHQREAAGGLQGGSRARGGRG
jgi:hypothetical protein